MTLIQVILHLGLLISTGKDVFQGIKDLLAGHAKPEELKAVIEDVIGLVKADLIQIPGVESGQLVVAIVDVEKAIGVA